MTIPRLTREGWQVWGRPLGFLALLLFGPLLLLATPLSAVAVGWMILLLLAVWTFLMGALIGAMTGASMPALSIVEGLLRRWVARFFPHPECLWLQWARQAHHPRLSHRYLDRAVALGGREAQFQEALVFLEGGLGAGGQSAGVERLRRAALRGHPEAAFRLAEALRTGHGSVLAAAGEAETWYQRAATLGFGPAAAWLTLAYRIGDGVPVDEAKAQHWSAVAESLQPHPPLSHSLLRHDAAPADALVRWTSSVVLGAEGVADQVLAHRVGRWGLLAGAFLLSAMALFVVGTFFWTGSSGLHHLPLAMLAPPVLLLAWQALQLRKDRPRTGRDRLLEAAEAGDPEACYRLGLAYRLGGRHRPKDALSAALWFREAAAAGHSGAMVALSEAYLGGHGVLRDPREAARWAETARRESTS